MQSHGPPTATRPPARFDADTGAAVAKSFDLKQLPAQFYDNPYPYFHALREASPVRRTFELRASHSPFMSVPRELADTLLQVAQESA